MRFHTTSLASMVAALLSQVQAQTWTDCNPLHTSCPSDRALGMSINVDFTQGEVNSFVASGKPTYGSDGVSFTVAAQGDSPLLMSTFYIMFGRVSVTMKAAPGRGIISSVVLQSDTLDEIDLEWIGTDNGQVQTNYFGKGIVSDYNRGQFNPAANNQEEWRTYTIDWTKDRILWTVDDTEIRTQTAEAAGDEYPQTPMQVKFGAWAGGDPGNPQGTIDWAGGLTNYADGPFTMPVRSIAISDYSTGKEYKYTDNSGSWESIEAVDGEINGNEGNVDAITVTGSATSSTESGAPQVPVGGFGGSGGDVQIDDSGVPDGWIMTEEGKLIPSGSSVFRPSLAMMSCFLAGVVGLVGYVV
ncbi:related to CRH1 - family of putative glycosidases might exert a common role in cell wall organiza [Cephalotrichum gorgonifer]|uniref:Crh-like protein n=1 Tax=Cephalotrichum gorgonifer TaxID=2041049 RepID=A0AAE8SQU8_9PEZI|nr:related to CRH1 - family of putative glycosidases might exert a common role in cell wall organiza [Cephalotrichum gorgonifer]